MTKTNNKQVCIYIAINIVYARNTDIHFIPLPL